MPVQAFESSHGKVDHQGGSLLGGRGEEVGCVQLDQFSAVLCTMIQMVLQVESADEDGASNPLNVALHHVSNLVEFSLQAKEITLNGCGRRSPAPCLEADVLALCCKPWVVQRFLCVLQLGAAVVRATEQVRVKRWLEWRWSFLFFGSMGRSLVGRRFWELGTLQ